MIAELPASALRQGLTKAKRAREGVSETLVGLVTGMPEARKNKEEVGPLKSAALNAQSDLPPVLAGPGRCIPDFAIFELK